MSTVQKPATQREMVEQLWYAIIGTNGEGIAARTKRSEDHIVEIRETLPKLVLRTECALAQEKRADANEAWRKYREAKRQQRAALIVSGVAVPILTAAAAYIF